MDRKAWKIRAGRDGDYWPIWKDKNVISVGWDIGNIKEKGYDWDETKQRIEKKYPNKPSGRATGSLRSFIGVRDNDSKNMEEGDFVVIKGPSVVYGVAKVGEFEYLDESLIHTQAYIRDVDFLFKEEGGIRTRDLPEKFQKGGEAPLYLRSTLSRYRMEKDEGKEIVDEDTIQELVENLEELDPISVRETDILTDFTEESLQRYIANNYEKLDENITEIIREYETSAGDADFYCETKDGKIKVIETKTGTAKHKAVAQLMSYMNAIRQDSGKDVSGLLIAEGFSRKADYALQSDDIKRKQWKATIKFSDV